MLTRRLLLESFIVMGAFLSGCSARPEATTSAQIVTLLGDSIAAGYGLDAKDALPSRLQEALTAAGIKAIVRGAGVSGDTTADGLARLDRSVSKDTTICVVELGANDFLQGIDPQQISDNLTEIATRLEASGIAVILLGGLALPGTPPAYAKRFNTAFADAARRTHSMLVPDFLNGILQSPYLVQADRVHPSAAGVKILAQRLVPAVTDAIQIRQRKES